MSYSHLLNLYHSLGDFSRRQSDILFLFFPENWIRYFMQIVSNLHEISKPVFCEKKKEKNISKCRLLKFEPRVLSVTDKRLSDVADKSQHSPIIVSYSFNLGANLGLSVSILKQAAYAKKGIAL